MPILSNSHAHLQLLSRHNVCCCRLLLCRCLSRALLGVSPHLTPTLCVCLCLCLSVFLSACLSVLSCPVLYVCLSVCLSVSHCRCVSVLSVWSVCLHLFVSVCLSLSLSISLCSSLFMFVCVHLMSRCHSLSSSLYLSLCSVTSYEVSKAVSHNSPTPASGSLCPHWPYKACTTHSIDTPRKPLDLGLRIRGGIQSDSGCMGDKQVSYVLANLPTSASLSSPTIAHIKPCSHTFETRGHILAMPVFSSVEA